MEARDDRGLTSATEFSDAIEILVDTLENASQERPLSRNEQAVIDVVDTVGFVEQEGLQEFWSSPINQDQVIKSFDLIGAAQIVDVFNSSQWCRRKAVETSQFTEVESSHLSEIEEELHSELWEVPELLEAFIEDELEEEEA
ncbi:hypothetical protein HW115_15490 [Verrucomicrobiaceae bacterium N1E253]|uniref:DUF4375 domain-containing protein n=1 Tax=Oceaniferula marina TaxID=2748318 RepID=A0A851GPH4_9BACT|nr:hypothetical protein [Oceaniferula marina]NWK57025.1 hypothetical protein [Oceaniferula marina]